jgi:hypothetical protein
MELFSYILSLSVQKATDFHKLILYPATLLKLFMVCRNFCWSFEGVLGIRSCYLKIGLV